MSFVPNGFLFPWWEMIFFFSKRKYYLLKWFILYFKTLNFYFLLAVHEYVRQRGLTAAELFGSWTRWPRLPDASLTQGQNPEWKPLMFLSSCQLLSFALSLSLTTSHRILTFFLCHSHPSLLCCPLPSLLDLLSLSLRSSSLWSSLTSKSRLT